MRDKHLQATRIAFGLTIAIGFSIAIAGLSCGQDTGGWSGNGAPPPPPPESNGAPPPPPPDGQMGPGNGAPPPPPGSQNRQRIATTAAYTRDGGKETRSGQTIKASGANQSIVKVCNGGSLTLSDSTLTKQGGDTTNTENSDFYGLNAGVLAESKGRITLADCTITTNAQGANAVFATGNGSAITLNNTRIKTSGRGSARGLEATFGGCVTANNVDISTVGAHCAALATDRGEGAVTLNKGTLTTAGEGSPVIYSTGNITANGVKGTATGSEAAVIEGKNSITLNGTTLVGHLKCGAMLYQSFSGDAGAGTSVFTMTGGSLTAGTGPLFYCTNTRTSINLNGADLVARSGVLLNAAAGRWGRQGANGADVTLKAVSQKLPGDITCDAISTIAATFEGKTTLKGSINAEKTAKSITLSLDKTSRWEVTGTSWLTALADADKTLANISGNGFTVHYDPAAAANAWLGGKTFRLANGGSLTPR